MLIFALIVSAILSVVAIGTYYYVLWGYLPWWPEEEHYNHREN